MLTYTFSSSGSVFISVSGTPKGENLPRTLPRIGLVMELAKQDSEATVSWFGRGPGESYRDSKESQLVGRYTAPLTQLDNARAYEVPQESGNRTGTRWVEVSHPNTAGGLNVQFVNKNGEGDKEQRKLFDFQVSRYRMQDIAHARHPHELRGKEVEGCVLRLDAAHHGLGSGSCGPRTLDEYALLTGEFAFKVLLQGI